MPDYLILFLIISNSISFVAPSRPNIHTTCRKPTRDVDFTPVEFILNPFNDEMSEKPEVSNYNAVDYIPELPKTQDYLKAAYQPSETDDFIYYEDVELQLDDSHDYQLLGKSQTASNRQDKLHWCLTAALVLIANVWLIAMLRESYFWPENLVIISCLLN